MISDRLVVLALGLTIALAACDGGKDADSAAPADTGDPETDTVTDTDTDTDTDTAVDADGDGSPAGEDCDDDDADRYPGATEHCDGVDEDCDGDVDEGAVDPTSWYADVDGDGFGDLLSPLGLSCEPPSGGVADDGDCDDADPAVYPGADELCNGEDDDCDGSVPADEVDADGDGFLACDECNDDAPDAFPGAPELCDGLDTDCDGDATDAGLAARELLGVWTDATAELSAGSFGAPVVAPLAGDETIWLCDGTWYVQVASTWGVPSGALRGPSGRRDYVVVTGGGGVPVFDEANVHRLESLTFRDAGSSVIADYVDVDIVDVVWEQSGGLILADGEATVTDSVFADNVELGAHAGGLSATDATVTRTSFLRNQTAGSGGGLGSFGVMRLDDVTFQDNAAELHGGALFTADADFYAGGVIANLCTFDGNRAGLSGGAISVGGWTATADIEDTTFTGNSAGEDGGAIYALGVDLTDVTLEANTAGRDGGGLWTLNGALYVSDTFTRVDVFDNVAGGAGGGVWFYGFNATFDTVTLQDNAAAEGGGFYVYYLGSDLIGPVLIDNVADQGGNLFLDNADYATTIDLTATGGSPDDIALRTMAGTEYSYGVGGPVIWTCSSAGCGP